MGRWAMGGVEKLCFPQQWFSQEGEKTAGAEQGDPYPQYLAASGDFLTLEQPV